MPRTEPTQIDEFKYSCGNIPKIGDIVECRDDSLGGYRDAHQLGLSIGALYPIECIVGKIAFGPSFRDGRRVTRFVLIKRAELEKMRVIKD